MSEPLRRGRRKGTASELARRFGVSERTIRYTMAEPRHIYEERASARHERIRKLRAKGMTYREIAAQVDCTIGTVHYALKKDTETKAS